jgi:hypothetical protein
MSRVLTQLIDELNRGPPEAIGLTQPLTGRTLDLPHALGHRPRAKRVSHVRMEATR